MMQRTMIREDCSIREAGEGDWPRIAEFFGRHDHLGVNEAFLRRKYLENPAGRGRIFLLEDRKEEIEGTVGYLPHVIYSRGKSPATVMESVDLLLAPEVRGKKMFPELQGRAMKWVGGALIAFPNKRSEDVTVRLGWERFAPIEDWVIPVGPAVAPRAGRGRYPQALGRGFLKAYRSLFCVGKKRRIELKSVTKFEHPFDRLFHPSRVGRTSAYLNWRFVGNPVRPFELFEFHLEKRPVGYCVVSREEDAAVLYDYFSADGERECIQALSTYFSGTDRQWLVFRGVNLRLGRLGFFRLRAGRNLISYNLPHEPWVLTLGDSDW
jgi:hypothetical protein